MKIKIGDLTVRQLKKLQDKECNNHNGCKNCPYDDCCVIAKEGALEREIEVENEDER